MITAALGIYRRLFVYLRPYVGVLVVGASLALVVAAMEGAIAWLVKPAMDEIFIKRDLFMLKVIPLLLLGAYLVKGFARYGQSYLMASVGERVVAALRRALYTHIQRMPLSFFADLHSAELMSRVISDVNRLARVSSTVMVMAIRQVAMIIALLSVMFVREWRLTLIALLIFPVIGVVVRVIGKRLYKINKRAQEKIAELNVLLHEAFSGTKIVKAFGRERHEAGRFDRVNDHLLAGGVVAAIRDVVVHGVAEEKGVLGDDGHLGAERGLRHVAHVAAVDGDPAFGRVVEARHEVHQRRLARAAHAHESHHLAAPDLEVDVAQRRLRRARVAEGDGLEAQPGREAGERGRPRPVVDGGRPVEDLEHALYRGRRLLNGVGDPRQLPHWSV